MLSTKGNPPLLSGISQGFRKRLEDAAGFVFGIWQVTKNDSGAAWLRRPCQRRGGMLVRRVRGPFICRPKRGTPDAECSDWDEQLASWDLPSHQLRLGWREVFSRNAACNFRRSQPVGAAQMASLARRGEASARHIARFIADAGDVVDKPFGLEMR